MTLETINNKKVLKFLDLDQGEVFTWGTGQEYAIKGDLDRYTVLTGVKAGKIGNTIGCDCEVRTVPEDNMKLVITI